MGTIVNGPLTFAQVKARLTGQNRVHEDPRFSNRQKFGVWYGWNGVPWCAIFQSWGFRGSLGQIGGKVAGVWTLRARFQQQGRYGSTPKVGSLAIFLNDKHVEMVLAVYPSYVVTVGGNTSRADGTNYWGGEVALKRRSRSAIKGYCYPRYAATATTTKPPFKAGATLYRGGSNNTSAVKHVQHALNRLMNAGLVVDGKFGAATEAAVERYQSREHITVDGRVGPTTQRHLYDDGYPVYT